MKFLIILLLVVSCGKRDFLTQFGNDLKKGKDNIVAVSKKAIVDTANTGVKAIGDTVTEIAKDTGSIITEANEIKNYHLTHSGDTTEMIGSQLESIGQIPRDLGNEFLGTDSHSKEDLADLEKELDELRAEMYEELSEVNNSIYDAKFELNQAIEGVSADLSQSNLALQSAIDSVQTELLDEINRVKRLGKKALKKAIKKVNRKIRRVRQAINRVRRNVNSLEVVCQQDSVYIIFSGFVQFAEYCELESNRR